MLTHDGRSLGLYTVSLEDDIFGLYFVRSRSFCGADNEMFGKLLNLASKVVIIIRQHTDARY